ncbi:MAG TPA: DUF3887 domain-containing protein [Victivallales bacterium]|nr:DUF3887 domain-containing protein [Victivallales bacterium]
MKKFVVLSIVASALTACSVMEKKHDVLPVDDGKSSNAEKVDSPLATKVLSDAEKLVILEGYLDNLIKSVKDDDYKSYFKDFSKDHKDLIKEKDFKERNKIFREQCGDYDSREFIGVLKKQLFNVYLWKAKYSKLPKDEILFRMFVVEEENQLSVYAFNIQPF